MSKKAMTQKELLAALRKKTLGKASPAGGTAASGDTTHPTSGDPKKPAAGQKPAAKDESGDADDGDQDSQILAALQAMAEKLDAVGEALANLMGAKADKPDGDKEDGDGSKPKEGDEEEEEDGKGAGAKPGKDDGDGEEGEGNKKPGSTDAQEPGKDEEEEKEDEKGLEELELITKQLEELED